MKHDFRVIFGCPCPIEATPYVYIVLTEAKLVATSIYRGSDARAILNAHGKMDQAQLYARFLAGNGFPADQPGTSTHECRSDGRAYPRVPLGGYLEGWQVGIDLFTVSEGDAIWKAHVAEDVARKHGWHLHRPYKSGSEAHHLNFIEQPLAHGVKDKLRVAKLRRMLPRR